MPEPAGPGPPTAGMAEREVLLATKLHIPRPRPGFLPRARLLARLAEGTAREFTLVCTPAGFGKTTLLADWARSTKWPVAWLSLDEGDNDPVRFWRYVLAALDRAGAPVGERVQPLLQTQGGASSEGMVTALINELEALPDEVALILDDYHLLESAPIHEGMALLLRRLPPQLHVVISSRSDPPLPLARLRARGQLAELRAIDLRFTPGESAAFLREVWGLDLSPEAVAAVETRTEGWAVGLQLAALSLRERPDPQAFLDDFRGSHRYVVDYLSEEILARQPEQLVRFLLETSVLERLCGPLCDAVTGGSEGQNMLEELERANLFLVPLDEQRRWYRLHHLFGDLLRARLRRAQGGRVPELHRQAAAWCEQHGLIDETIRHALASGDATWATRLVEQHLGETLRRGESVMLARWLSLLPDDAVQSRPALCLAQGLMQFQLGHLDAVERLLLHAERAFDRGQEVGRLELPTHGGMVAEVSAAIALLKAGLATARGDPERATWFAQLALAQMTEHERGARFWARWLELLADWMGGRMEDAEAGFAEVLAGGTGAPPQHMVSTFLTLGRVQQARGKLSAALHTCREGLRFATRGGRFLPFHAGESQVGIAQVLYERNELDAALEHVTKGIELTRRLVEFQLPALGLVTLAWIRQAMGHADAALSIIDEACRIHPATEIVSLLSPAQAERARLLLAQGQMAEAERWVRERGLTEQDKVTYPRERDHLMLARVLLASSQADRALGLLARLHALAAAQGRVGSVIEVRALQALALATVGDQADAQAALADALTLAAPEGYLRVFVNEGAPMATLLGRLAAALATGKGAAARPPAAFLRRLSGAFAQAGLPVPARPRRGAAVAGLMVPLSGRELEVLQLLAAGKPNQAIAEELVITLDTVKSHVTHILDKLGVANRTQAVARARELGLLR